jgi:hypothetical protein
MLWIICNLVPLQVNEFLFIKVNSKQDIPGDISCCFWILEWFLRGFPGISSRHLRGFPACSQRNPEALGQEIVRRQPGESLARGLGKLAHLTSSQKTGNFNVGENV